MNGSNGIGIQMNIGMVKDASILVGYLYRRLVKITKFERIGNEWGNKKTRSLEFQPTFG